MGTRRKKVLYTRQAHNQEIYKISWHPSGTNIASLSKDGTFGIWNALTGYCIYSNKSNSHKDFHDHIDNYDSDHANWNNYNNKCTNISHIISHISESNSNKKEKVIDIDWNHSGHLLASCNTNNEISFWDFNTGLRLQIINSNKYTNDLVEITQTKWHPLKTILASCSNLCYQPNISIWDPYTVYDSMYTDCVSSLQKLCLNKLYKHATNFINESDDNLTQSNSTAKPHCFTWGAMKLDEYNKCNRLNFICE